MVRRLLTVLVAGAVSFCGMSSALSAQDPPIGQDKPVQVVATAGGEKPERNQLPLAPGKAAGITPAQGAGERAWHIVGIGFIAGVALWMILDHVDDDDDDSPVVTTTTGN
jgi:hypothetical protein